MGATMNFGGRPLGPLRPAFTLCREPLLTTIWRQMGQNTQQDTQGDIARLLEFRAKALLQPLGYGWRWRVSMGDWAGARAAP